MVLYIRHALFYRRAVGDCAYTEGREENVL